MPPLTPGPRSRRVRRYLPRTAIVLLAATVALLAIRPDPIGTSPDPGPVQSPRSLGEIAAVADSRRRLQRHRNRERRHRDRERDRRPARLPIGDVDNADRSDYVETRVYFPPGAEAIARCLADDLGVAITALPGVRTSAGSSSSSAPTEPAEPAVAASTGGRRRPPSPLCGSALVASLLQPAAERHERGEQERDQHQCDCRT